MKDEEMAEKYLKEKLEERKDKFIFELPEVYITDVKQAFLAGLKAGRPQWHYVKDGDLPKEYDKPYLCKVYSHFEVGYFTAYKDQPWHFDEYYLDNEDVIAWKEIVLPKEIE